MANSNGKYTKTCVVGLLLVIVLVSSLIFLSCRRKNEPDQRAQVEETSVVVGYLPVSTSLPNWVAKVEGFDRKRGLRVEFRRYANSNLLLTALMDGEIQATSVCADEPILAAASQRRGAFEIYLQELLTVDRLFDAIVVKSDSPIRSLADLQNKTVACFPGSQLQVYLKIILQKVGVRPEDLRIVQLPPPNMLPALESGTVDACFVLEPVITTGKVKGLIRVVSGSPIAQYIGEGKSICAASYLISTDWADKHPEAADSLVSAVYEAVDLIKSDYARTSRLYAEFTPIPADIAAKVVITDFAKVTQPDVEGLEKEVDILRSAGIVEGNVDVKKLLYRWRGRGEEDVK